MPKTVSRKLIVRLARLHFWSAFFSFAAYLGFGFALGPDFFRGDIMKRVSAFADDIITVTAVVLGPPAQPIVIATPVCISGVPHINLDWADDVATDTWDIERDSLLLSTGAVISQYADTAVVPDATYSYAVTAYGPMAPGSAVSAPVSVTAPDCPVFPPGAVTIETLGGRFVASDRASIVLDRSRPQVTGTANIASALIRIIMTNPAIEADIVANANGYFSWVPPVRLENGGHVLSVTAIDPDDPSRTATDSFAFRTRDSDTDDSDGGSAASVSGASHPGSATARIGIGFTASVNGGAEFVFQGDQLDIAIATTGTAFPEGTVFSAFILDASGREMRGLGLPVDGSGRSFFHIAAKAPLSLEPGTYRIRIDAVHRGRIVSREVAIGVRAWPLIRFGENAEVTYYEVASLIGTIFFLLLSLLILFILLFIREYWLYMHHIRHVTERHLAAIGLISQKRKGVAKS